MTKEDRSLDYYHRMRYKKENPGMPVPDQIYLKLGRQNNQNLRSIKAVCQNVYEDETYICKVCCSYLKREKLPPKSATNYLYTIPVPYNVQLKSYLEEALIARVLLFIKIFSLKSSLMPAMKDKCIVIPLEGKDIKDTVESLPRLPSESGIIDIQWKRRVGQKNAHLHAKVDPARIYNALQFLKEKGNIYYQDVQHLDDYEARCQY